MQHFSGVHASSFIRFDDLMISTYQFIWKFFQYSITGHFFIMQIQTIQQNLLCAHQLVFVIQFVFDTCLVSLFVTSLTLVVILTILCFLRTSTSLFFQCDLPSK